MQFKNYSQQESNFWKKLISFESIQWEHVHMFSVNL